MSGAPHDCSRAAISSNLSIIRFKSSVANSLIESLSAVAMSGVSFNARKISRPLDESCSWLRSNGECSRLTYNAPRISISANCGFEAAHCLKNGVSNSDGQSISLPSSKLASISFRTDGSPSSLLAQDVAIFCRHHLNRNAPIKVFLSERLHQSRYLGRCRLLGELIWRLENA